MTGIPFLGDVDLGRHLGSEARASWLAVADLAETFDHQTWMIVGGQMVLIHAARTGVTMPRVTTDIDLVVDVRAARRAHAKQISAWLVERGFAIERNDEGTDRYRRDDARIDLLAPDNLGRRPVSTADGGRILAAPGSTNAFKRSVTVRCVLGDGLAPVVRCPTAFGALMSKAEACVRIRESASRRLRHQQDIVSLASALAVDGYEDDRSTAECRRFSEATAPLFADDGHEAWAGASEDARQVLRMLRLTDSTRGR